MTKTQPKVSIIICNHNYSAFIGDAIESVKNQSLKNWECIIIDDASTDTSVSVIKKHIARDKRFQLIQLQKKSGVCVARNSGLDVATGEYIAFLDSDDCFTEYALEMLLHMAQTTNADMAGGATNIVPNTFKYIPSKQHSWNASMMGARNNPAAFLLMPKSHNWCWIWRRIYKRSLIGDTRFNTNFTTFGDDLTFMLDLCYRANFVVETSNISVYHRIHGDAITSREFGPHYFDWFPTYFEHIEKNLLDKYDSHFWRAFYRNTFSYMLYETTFRPKHMGKYEIAGRNALLASVQHIPRRYLTAKQRILCKFLTWIKK
ncbi:MAG: glycosyltransferase family 2 protein [Alphaproteobacteria bacterium]|nr:glycosyltransferase family 2 protein [Alphaproteobacteria bacterium]